MSANPQTTVPLMVGTVLLTPEGKLIVRARSRGWLHVMDEGGNAREPLTIKQGARLLMSANNPPPDTPLVHGLAERLSPAGLRKLAYEDNYVSLIRTGLPLNPRAGECPPPEIDPAHVPDERARFRAVARIYAAERGTTYESAKVQLDRILSRLSGGLGARVDGSYTSPRRTYTDARLGPLVEAFLLHRAQQSTTSVTTQWLQFVATQRQHHPDVPEITQGTFRRRRAEVVKRYPHLATRAVTRISATKRNKRTFSPRRVTRPGEVWIADSTTGNVLLWDPRSNKSDPTFRPIVTIVMDLATGSIVGRSVTKQADSMNVGLALADAFASMVDGDDFVEIEGRRFARPFVGFPRAMATYPVFPESLVVDNGKPYLSSYTIAQAQRLDVDYEPARSFSPDDKPQVESTIGSVRKMWEEHQPGYISFTTTERGDHVEDKAVLRYQDYIERLDQWIKLYNYHHVHTGLHLPSKPGHQFTPYEMWQELSDGMGRDDVPTWENEWLRYLPSFDGTIATDGVSWKNLLYDGRELQRMRETPGLAIAGKHRFYRNPADLRYLYCFDENGDAYAIPWVRLTADTPVFGEYGAEVAKESFANARFNKAQYQMRLVELLIEWEKQNEVNRRFRNDGGDLGEEMLEFSLGRLRNVDTGTIRVSAPPEETPAVLTVSLPPTKKAPRPSTVVRVPGNLYGALE